MVVPEITIFALQNSEEAPLPWGQLHDSAIVNCLSDQLSASVEQRRNNGRNHIVIDCTAVDFPAPQIESLDPAESHLIVCRPGNPDAVLRSIGPRDRIWWYHPHVFEPVIVEAKRILREGGIGDFRGAEIFVVAGSHIRQLESTNSMIPLIISGSPKGVKGSTKPPGAFYWFDGPAIFVGSAPSSDPSPSISGTFVFSRGSLIFKSGEDRISIYPAGAPPQFVPLPEGDGTYYFMRELLRSIAADGESPISTAQVREANMMAAQIEGRM